MKEQNVEVKEEKRNLKNLVKKHKKNIIGGITIIGGLCLLQLTYKEGERNGLQKGYSNGVEDIKLSMESGVDLT